MVAPLLATTVAHGAPSRSHQKNLAIKKKCPNRAFQKKVPSSSSTGAPLQQQQL